MDIEDKKATSVEDYDAEILNTLRGIWKEMNPFRLKKIIKDTKSLSTETVGIFEKVTDVFFEELLKKRNFANLFAVLWNFMFEGETCMTVHQYLKTKCMNEFKEKLQLINNTEPMSYPSNMKSLKYKLHIQFLENCNFMAELYMIGNKLFDDNLMWTCIDSLSEKNGLHIHWMASILLIAGPKLYAKNKKKLFIFVKKIVKIGKEKDVPLLLRILIRKLKHEFLNNTFYHERRTSKRYLRFYLSLKKKYEFFEHILMCSCFKLESETILNEFINKEHTIDKKKLEWIIYFGRLFIRSLVLASQDEPEYILNDVGILIAEYVISSIVPRFCARKEFDKIRKWAKEKNSLFNFIAYNHIYTSYKNHRMSNRKKTVLNAFT